MINRNYTPVLVSTEYLWKACVFGVLKLLFCVLCLFAEIVHYVLKKENYQLLV